MKEIKMSHKFDLENELYPKLGPSCSYIMYILEDCAINLFGNYTTMRNVLVEVWYEKL